jgi:hypothetical protein
MSTTDWLLSSSQRLVHKRKRFHLRSMYLKISSEERYLENRKYICKSYPCKRPLRPIVLRDIEDPTLFRQSAYRWQ